MGVGRVGLQNNLLIIDPLLLNQSSTSGELSKFTSIGVSRQHRPRYHVTTMVVTMVVVPRWVLSWNSYILVKWRGHRKYKKRRQHRYILKLLTRPVAYDNVRNSSLSNEGKSSEGSSQFSISMPLQQKAKERMVRLWWKQLCWHITCQDLQPFSVVVLALVAICDR